MPSTFKFLECFILTVIADFGETIELRRRILKHDDVFDMVLKSLLRVRVMRGEQIEDSGTSAAAHEYNSRLLREIFRITSHAVCK